MAATENGIESLNLVISQLRQGISSEDIRRSAAEHGVSGILLQNLLLIIEFASSQLRTGIPSEKICKTLVGRGIDVRLVESIVDRLSAQPSLPDAPSSSSMENVSSSSSNQKRRHERVLCGLPMEFDHYVGNAIELNGISVFFAFATLGPGSPGTVPSGQKGILKFKLGDHTVEEKAVVGRVTKMGAAIISLEAHSQLPRLMLSVRKGIKLVTHLPDESIIHFKGDFDGDIYNEFVGIYKNREPGRKYRLNFHNVSSIAPSGLAMLLQLESYNHAENGGVKISQCNKKVMQSLAKLEVPGIDITVSPYIASSDDEHKFDVTVSEEKNGSKLVTIKIPRLFDYNCKDDFLKIYHDKPKRTNYILDFENNVFVGKAAIGSMLLMNHYCRELGDRIRIVNCKEHARKVFDGAQIGKFFDIE